MRICFLGYMTVHGGIQRNIINLGNLLSDDFEIIIISMGQRVYVPYKKKSNIRVIPLLTKGHFQETLKLYKILRNLKPDIVVGFWLPNLISSVLIKTIASYRCVYAERNDPSNKEYGILLRFCRTVFFPFVDGFIFQHRFAKEFFPSYVQEKSYVIPNSVNVGMKCKSVYRHIITKLISVGRLHEQKNHKLIIDAISRMHTSYPKIELDIYGDGGLHDELVRYIAKLGLQACVTIHAATTDIYEVMIASDMFVLSSDYEGMPNVLLEAMALGLPCVSTDYSIGGVTEIINNGANGLIVRRDSIDDLQEKIEFLIKNPGIAEQMGRAGRRIIQTNAPERIGKMWKGMFKTISQK